jgi:soluble lytic murein transglycosylase-like protein
MARIAIIALMLFAAAPALAQQPDMAAPAAPAPTAPPAQTEPSKSAPHPSPLPAGGERERTETPAAPPSAATDTPPAASPPTTADAPPAAGPTPPPPAPTRTGNVDVRESLCLMIESAARSQNLPLEFFARVIWQESRFQSDVVGPRTRSGDRAQGIAQFMPRTAAERGLLDPFDPVQALPKSAEFLRELADQFGNLGLAAAAYNAGPGRLREFLSGRRPLPAETRNYVLAITGISVDEWASSGKREPLHVPKAGCGELMALLHRAPNPFVQKLEERVNVVAAAPWGVQLAAGFSRDHALSNYASLAKRYADLLAGRDPSLLSSILRSRGTQPFYQVRVGADTRAAAETLCGSIRRAGGACFVLRNRAG